MIVEIGPSMWWHRGPICGAIDLSIMMKIMVSHGHLQVKKNTHMLSHILQVNKVKQ